MPKTIKPVTFGTIISGLVRSLPNNNSTAKGRKKGPLTTTWEGQESSDLRAPIEKEQTQNPQLDWGLKSSGTAVSWSQTVPTVDYVREQFSQYPRPSQQASWFASSIGSMIQPMPSEVPLNQMQNSGYEMMPVDGGHFKNYFANQLGQFHIMPIPNPANVMANINESQGLVTDGSSDIWKTHRQLDLAMQKGYSPAQSFRGK